MELTTLAGLLLAGLLAGAANTIAGSGSAISLPMLLAAGLSPALANGSNHVAHLAGALPRLVVFHRSGGLDWRTGSLLAVPATIGAVLGAWFAGSVSAQLLKWVVLAGVVIALVLLLANPKRLLAGTSDQAPRCGPVALIILFLAGWWAGFIVIDSGTFLLLALTWGVGYGMVRAIAAKALITLLAFSFAALIFVVRGEVDWAATLVLSAGTMSGSWVTAHGVTNPRAQVWVYWGIVLFVAAEAVYLVAQLVWPAVPVPHVVPHG